MSRRKLLVFDFDGTLADTQAALDLGLKEFSDANGLPHDPKKMATGYVDPTQFDLGWGLSLEQQPEYLKQFHYYLDNHCVDDRFLSPLFDGVHDFLQAVEDEFLCAVVTVRDRNSFLRIAEHNAILNRFIGYRTFCCAKERGYAIKPKPDALNCLLQEVDYSPEEVIVIGDTTSDIRMAKGAGAKSIGVLWGAHDRERLSADEPDAIAENVVDLRDIIARL